MGNMGFLPVSFHSETAVMIAHAVRRTVSKMEIKVLSLLVKLGVAFPPIIIYLERPSVDPVSETLTGELVIYSK